MVSKVKKSPKNKVEKVSLGKKGSFNVHKGALHQALGIPVSEPIGQARIKKAENSQSPEVRRMADSAAGLTAMGRK